MTTARVLLDIHAEEVAHKHCVSPPPASGGKLQPTEGYIHTECPFCECVCPPVVWDRDFIQRCSMPRPDTTVHALPHTHATEMFPYSAEHSYIRRFEPPNQARKSQAHQLVRTYSLRCTDF
eukprot:CAMPEP_0118925868 /NCGR_PEP_ID=MMETSP1169-20130426/3684_1 /TAXON_ID=36882 /ORGANISM="Pyramimonas obovata, Strain CCMP722" /LENGTH=120 /DNA_ID=CAMNT_0006867287 /DNA_START=647 /DNA_END=1006 /DNA_ORIENTATION=-